MKIFYIASMFLVVYLSCTQKNTDNLIDLDQVKADLNIIKNNRIYFGHQSVGNNIIAGIEDLVRQTHTEGLNIVNIDQTSNLPENYFAHSRIGQNKHPMTKIEAFKEVIIDRFNGDLDLAILKFCYVDFTPSTKAEKIFNAYNDMINDLKIKFPSLNFLHVTAPVMANSGGIKIKIKRLIGKEDYTDLPNIARNKYGILVKNTYNVNNVFDVAKVEATKPDGSLETFTKNGEKYFSLVHDYTYDGGHLNQKGRIFVAAKFLRAIARVLQEKNNLAESH